MTKVKWGVIGPGYIAHEFAKLFQETMQSEIYAVYGLTEEDAVSYQKEFGLAKAYWRLDDFLNDDEITVAYIATPCRSHQNLIKACLTAGKHVLCEKTITMTAEQLEECVNIAKAKKLILAEELTSVYEPVMRFMKEKVSSGSYGKIHFVTVTFGSCKPYDIRNRFFNPENGGGALFDIGCYAIGFANYFMSSYPKLVKSEGVLCDLGVDLKSAYVLRNKEDELATVMIAFRSKTEKIGVIACENAWIKMEHFHRGSTAEVEYFDGRKEKYEFPVRHQDAAIEAMNEDILAGRTESSVCPVELSLSVLKIMDEARKQWGYAFDFEK